MYIYTRKNQPIEIDDKYFEELSKYTWVIDGNGYAITSIYIMSRKESRESGLSRKKTIKMHRLIYQLEYKKVLLATDHIDHINQNKVDNRIDNLRVSALGSSINQINVGLRKDNTTGAKGVIFRQKTQKFEAKISYHGKRIWLGAYKNINEAINAYNEKAKELFGHSAFLNNFKQTT